MIHFLRTLIVIHLVVNLALIGFAAKILVEQVRRR